MPDTPESGLVYRSRETHAWGVSLS